MNYKTYPTMILGFLLSVASPLISHAQYCTGPINGGNGTGEWITNVSFADVNHPTDYAENTANTINAVANVTPGEIVDFSVEVTADGFYSEAVKIYFDFDNDFIFETSLDLGTQAVDDSGVIYDENTAPNGNNTVTMPTTLGTYRMRVVVDFIGPVPGPCDSDNTNSFTDSEDYEITVAEVPPNAAYCAGPVNGGSTGEWITNVSFADVNHPTDYAENTANTINAVANVAPGEMVDFRVEVTTDGFYSEAVKIYFDFDQNFTLESSLDLGTQVVDNNGAVYDENSAPSGSNTVTMPTTPGTYRMRVIVDFVGPVPGPCGSDNPNSFTDSEDYEIRVVSSENDLCENAIELACGDVILGTTINSTYTEDLPQCDGAILPSRGVWFTIVGTGQPITIDTDHPNTDFDTGLSVYTSGDGCNGPFSCFAADDDGGANETSVVTFTGEAGVTYYVHLEGFGNEVGNYGLSVNCCALPVAACTSFTAALNGDGMLTIAAADVDAGSSADCGLASLEVSPNLFTCSDIGAQMVTLTVVDNNGDSSTCTATVTVEDRVDPEAICPADITVPNDVGNCGANVDFDIDVSDNCSGATVVADPPSGSFFPVGTTTVTVTATDAAGNMDVCTFDVSVIDTEDPKVTCPADITQENDVGDCGAIVEFSIERSDNCPGTTVSADPPSGSFFPVGTTTVTVTATSAVGNTTECTFDVTVNDTEDPVLTCTDELFVGTDPGECAATIALPVPGAIDNCDIVRFEFRYVAVDENNNKLGPFTPWAVVTAGATITLPEGRFRIRFRADDAAGNRDGCNQFVTVTDNEAPMITACAGTTVNFNGEESFNSEDVIDFAATDNCGIVSTTFDPPLISCEDLGTTVVVTVTVTDEAGNSESCTTDVVVDGLPCGFMLTELGCEGDADYDIPTETFTLEATNCYYANPFNQDKITFVQTELCGDFELIAEVTNIQPFAWAGIMMRETLDAGSKKVSLARDNGFFARRESRKHTGGVAYPQPFPAFGKNWLRLVRQGNQFIGYLSPNGVNWQQVMVANVSMSECIFVGLFLTNKQPNQTVTADFRNVEVNEAGGLSLQQLSTTAPSTVGTISVYPNPTAGTVTVDLGELLDKKVQLELRNTNGQLLRQLDLGRVSERRTELQLGDLPVGIYWLRVQAAGEAPITERIVIQQP